MKKMPHTPMYPEMLRSLFWHGNTRPGSGRARRSLIASLAFLVVLLSILAWIGLTRQIQAGSRPAVAATSPIAQVEPPRRDSSLAYDPAHHVLLLFGGTILTPGGARTNETWAWNGQGWRQLHPATSPPALQGRMVYDAASRQMILFLNQVQSGGNVANEMWAWDGSSWHQLLPPLMPEVLDTSMAYDAAQGQVLLFGGETPGGHAGVFTNATWTWNGTTWQEQHLATSPSPRAGAAMTYDAAHQQMVLFGGTTLEGLSTETWTWNGRTWQQRQVTDLPSARQNGLLVYDSATQQTLLFGGMNTGGTQPAPSDTWAWNGSDWTRVSAQGAPTDFYEGAAYDNATRAVTVYAVQGFVNKLKQPGTPAPVSKTWIWNGTVWKLLS